MYHVFGTDYIKLVHYPTWESPPPSKSLRGVGHFLFPEQKECTFQTYNPEAAERIQWVYYPTRPKAAAFQGQTPPSYFLL